MDVSEQDHTIINECKKTDPFGLTQIITDQGINTVIIDSITRVSSLALKYVVPFNKGATDTNPTQGGYGMRNLIVVNFLDTMIKLTKRLNCNIIFIMHEGAPDKNDSGNIISVSMMLGGQLPGLVSKDISEVWLLSDSMGKRRISIRPERLRTPMKSRMFDQETDTGFEWKFSPRTPDKGHTIASFWKQWCDGKEAKLMVPK
jgi:hypothetical protein